MKRAVACRAGGAAVIAGEPANHVVRVLETDLNRALNEEWVYRAELKLAPGSHRLAVTVVDEPSGITSTAIAPVDIPAAR